MTRSSNFGVLKRKISYSRDSFQEIFKSELFLVYKVSKLFEGIPFKGQDWGEKSFHNHVEFVSIKIEWLTGFTGTKYLSDSGNGKKYAKPVIFLLTLVSVGKF